MMLVTGATGFVGTALVAELRRRGIAHRPLSRRSSIGFFSVGDLGPETDWTEALSGIDTVLHLAAHVHDTRESAQAAEASHGRINTLATLRLAGEAARLGVRRFIFVSSIKVNGDATQEGRPFTAEDIPHPVGAYARSKLAAEEGLLNLARDTGLEVVIVRPPLVYGPGVKGNLRSLAAAVSAGIPLPLGAVRNRRSLVHVETLVELLILCTHHPAAPGNVFLVSDDQDVSTSELLRQIGFALGRRPLLIPVPTAILHLGLALLGRRSVAERLLGNLQVDTTKTKLLLGWAPRIPVAEGVRRGLLR